MLSAQVAVAFGSFNPEPTATADWLPHAADSIEQSLTRDDPSKCLTAVAVGDGLNDHGFEPGNSEGASR